MIVHIYWDSTCGTDRQSQGTGPCQKNPGGDGIDAHGKGTVFHSDMEMLNMRWMGFLIATYCIYIYIDMDVDIDLYNQHIYISISIISYGYISLNRYNQLCNVIIHPPFCYRRVRSSQRFHPGLARWCPSNTSEINISIDKTTYEQT